MGTNRSSISGFLIVTGSFFILVFGSFYAITTLRSSQLGEIRRRMDASTLQLFASLDRSQEKTFFNDVHYYYSYSGKYRNERFHTVEEVDPVYYHKKSEGKNVEIIAYLDKSDMLHTHLRDNKIPYGKRFDALSRFAFLFLITGCASFASGLALFLLQRAGLGRGRAR